MNSIYNTPETQLVKCITKCKTLYDYNKKKIREGIGKYSEFSEIGWGFYGLEEKCKKKCADTYFSFLKK